MKVVNDILTAEEIARYEKEWRSFRNRYDLNSEYSTHSGKPVISQVFRFEDKFLFRAHVFNRRLRKIDPYFISKKYVIPFWHIAHYLTALEQMYHASMREVRDTNRFITKDVPEEFKLSKPIFWGDNISVELIWDLRRQTGKYSIEDCYFTLYDDKTETRKGQVSLRTFVEPRAYVKDIEAIREVDEQALESLIKKIEMQDVNQRRLIKQRRNLQPTKAYLIDELRKGTIPEKELDDLFSLWDKEPEPEK